MKRSELNQIMRDNVEFIDKMNFKLPPFANGRKRVANTTRSETICSVGILPTLVREIF